MSILEYSVFDFSSRFFLLGIDTEHPSSSHLSHAQVPSVDAKERRKLIESRLWTYTQERVMESGSFSAANDWEHSRLSYQFGTSIRERQKERRTQLKAPTEALLLLKGALKMNWCESASIVDHRKWIQRRRALVVVLRQRSSPRRAREQTLRT